MIIINKENVLLNIHQVLYKKPPNVNEKYSCDCLWIYYMLDKLYKSNKGVITWEGDFHCNIELVMLKFSVKIEIKEDGFSHFKKSELSVNVDFEKWKCFMKEMPFINLHEWKY